MMPGMPEKRTHDYFRHGTTSLFAAMNVQDGTVIAFTHRRHRAREFREFLATIDQTVPEHLDMHVICDNYGTHTPDREELTAEELSPIPRALFTHLLVLDQPSRATLRRSHP